MKVKRSLAGKIKTLEAESTKIKLKIQILEQELKQVSQYSQFLQRFGDDSPNPPRTESREQGYRLEIKDLNLYNRIFETLHLYIEFFDRPETATKHSQLVQIFDLLVTSRVLDLSPLSGDRELIHRILERSRIES